MTCLSWVLYLVPDHLWYKEKIAYFCLSYTHMSWIAWLGTGQDLQSMRLMGFSWVRNAGLSCLVYVFFFFLLYYFISMVDDSLSVCWGHANGAFYLFSHKNKILGATFFSSFVYNSRAAFYLPLNAGFLKDASNCFRYIQPCIFQRKQKNVERTELVQRIK